MSSLRIEIGNPDARRVKTADGLVWVCASDSGCRTVDHLPLERAWPQLVDDLDDGVLIGVTLHDGTPTVVRAFRAAASSYDLFFAETDRGALLLTDQFARALAVIPRDERRVSRAIVADHLLFRAVPGAQTYVEAVGRLGHGEEIVWRPGEAQPSRRLRQTLGSRDSLVPGARDVVDQILEEVIRPLASLDGVENMLSGGVDSTLVHTYLGRSVPSVSGALTSAEFAFEIDYARQASALLGNQHRMVQLEEDAYLGELERCVDGMALPPHHLQTVLLDAVFRSGGARFVTAQFADSLFGLDVDVAVNRIWKSRWLWQLATGNALLIRAVRATGVRKASTLLRVGEELSRSTHDPRGFAMGFGVHTDMDLAIEILGADLVARRLQARLEYVERRLEGGVPRSGSASSHLHAGHWIHFFCDETISLWRQAALARGRVVHCPFTSRRVCEAALAIPSPERYVRHGRAKHVLKDLLARRLPAYPVDQRKGSSGLPFARFWMSGPLHGVTERYPWPDFVEPALRRRLVDEPRWLGWNIFTLALWEQRVLKGASSLPAASHVFDI
jgi:hypothetical protein